MAPAKDSSPKVASDQYEEKEALERFEAALRSGLNTPHKPLKEKPKAKKTANKTKPKKK